MPSSRRSVSSPPDGTYDGFDLAMAKELCARLGWEYEAVAIDWNSKDAELSSGTINCIWNGFTYTGRENDYTFSDPYVDNSIVMVVKADSGITSLADLAGKSVMAQAASSAVDAINENEDFKASLKEVVELGDYNMGFMDLAQGTVDAVAADLGVAQYQIANNDGDYVILDEPLSTEQYAIGFLKGNTELRDAVNAELSRWPRTAPCWRSRRSTSIRVSCSTACASSTSKNVYLGRL